MAEANSLNASNIDKRKNKTVYSSPKLIKYGEVRTLVQAGSLGSNENSSSNPANPNFMTSSDRATKENIVRIGTHPLDIGLYLFDYRPEFRDQHGHGRQFGVMADEVEKVMPEAVSLSSIGYKQVNYTMLGIERTAP